MFKEDCEGDNNTCNLFPNSKSKTFMYANMGFYTNIMLVIFISVSIVHELKQKHSRTKIEHRTLNNVFRTSNTVRQ